MARPRALPGVPAVASGAWGVPAPAYCRPAGSAITVYGIRNFATRRIGSAR